MDVVGVPIEIGNTAIVLSSVQHDEVQKGAELEASPDAEIVGHLDLPDWHPSETSVLRNMLRIHLKDLPLEVSSYGVHLPLVGGNATIFYE